MANNVTTQTGPLATVPSDITIATNEIDGVHHQVFKLAYGPPDTATLVREDVPLPVIFADLIEGGVGPYTWVSTDGLNERRVKNSPGLIYSVQVSNTNAAPAYIKFFDTGSFPVAGSDEVVKNLLIPGSTTGAPVVLSWPKGLAFNHGIGFALTTGVAVDNTDPVVAGEIVVNIDFI